MKLGNTALVCKNEDVENYIELKPNDYIQFQNGLFIENKGKATLKIELPKKIEASLLDEDIE